VLPVQQFFAIRDSLHADGSFFLHHFNALFLKHPVSSGTGGNVIFVGLAQSLFHYESVARKISLNLGAKRKRARFHFVNILQNPIATSSASSSSSDSSITNLSFASTDSAQSQLKTLFQTLYALFTQYTKDNTKCCVIIDDLHALLNIIGPDQRSALLDFVHYCYATFVVKGKGTLLTLMHEDIEDDARMLDAITYQSDVTVYVDQLKSGLSQVVHGSLSFLSKEKTTLPPLLHFKLLENNLNIFRPGEANVV